MKPIRSLFLGVLFLTVIRFSAFGQTTEPKIAVGASQSLVLTDDGSVYTFGSGAYGSTGQTLLNRNDIAAAITHSNLAGKTIVDISTSTGSGTSFSLLLASDGTVFSFGRNDTGQLGHGDTIDRFYPTQITNGGIDTLTISAISAGGKHSVLLTDEGTVYVFGDNNNYYIGLGTSAARPVLTPTPLTHSNLDGYTITAIEAGLNFSFLTTSDSSLFSYGENLNGQLGDGSTIGKTVPTLISKTQFDNKSVLKAVAATGASLVLAEDSTVYSWGNFRASLGQGNPVSDLVNPTILSHTNITGKKFIEIYRNEESAFLVASDGNVYSFGEESSALGLDTTANVKVPTQITHSSIPGKTIIQAGAGYNHSLLLASDGTVFSMGDGVRGELGTNFSGKAYVPFNVDSTNFSGNKIVKIEAGRSLSLLLAEDGTVYSFGGGFYDETLIVLGRDNEYVTPTPKKLSSSSFSGENIVDVAAAGARSFLLSESGKVYALGYGVNGRLGTGDSLNAHVPTLIDHTNLTGKKIIQIATSDNNTTSSSFISHTLLLADDGTIFSFGDNAGGQLGLGDFNERTIPTAITHPNLSGKTIIKIAAEAQHSVAVADDGSVFIWGEGSRGNMGFGNTDTLNVPTEHTNATITGKTIIDAAIGSGFSSGIIPHFILLAADSSVIAFGEGSDGQLGHGSKTDNTTPTIISSSNITGKKPIAVSAGEKTSMLLMNDGSIYSFGNTHRVGIEGSSFSDKSEPTLLNNSEVLGKKITTISSHHEHGLAIRDDGVILSFGSDQATLNRSGALGNGLPESGDETPQPIANFNWLTSPIPTTNLKMHVDAGRGLTTFGDSLNTWGDLSGNDNNLTQSILIQRPVLIDSAINNQRTIGFNGTNSYIVSPTTGTLGIQNSDYEVFMVAKTTSATNEIDFLLAGSNENFELHTNGTSGLRFIPNDGNYTDVGSVGDFSDGSVQLINARATSTTSTVVANRSGKAELSVNAQSSESAQLFVGVRTGGTFWFGGQIAEIIIYNTELSVNDRRKVESYLFKKYAIKNYKESSQQLTGAEGWRIMTSPVADSSFAPLLDSFWTQGFTGASVSHGTSNVYRWPNTSTGLSDTNWTSVSNMSDSLHPGEGVLVYVYSDDNGPGVEGNAGFPKTLKLEGREPEGTQTLTPLLNANVSGWALVGNPFRNDVDWDGFTRSGLSNSVYVYDINSASWKSWNGTLGSLTDGEVGPFNAFFVQTTEADPSLAIPISAKTDSAKRFLGKELVKSDPVYFSLEFKSDSGFTNKAWFQFSEDGQFGLDASDAHQLNPLTANYVTAASILNDSTHLDINSLPVITEPFEISLVLQTTESGVTHRISKGDLNLPEGWEVTLYDSELDITSNLEESYEFTMNAAKVKTVRTQDIASPPSLESFFRTDKQKRAGSRFTLTVSPLQTVSNEPVTDLPTEVELRQNYPNPFNPSTTIAYGVPATGKVTLEVFDILGRKVATLLNNENKTAGRYTLNFNASNLASGMYIYRLRAGNSVITKKLTLIK